MTPVFAVVEGIDGSGKSTLVNLVKQGLVDEGKTVWTTAEPTARMRKILEDNPDSYDPVSLFLLFTYDRYNRYTLIVQTLFYFAVSKMVYAYCKIPRFQRGIKVPDTGIKLK